MKITCLLLLTMSWATLTHGTGYAVPELVLSPFPGGEGVPQPAHSSAGVGRARGQSGPASQKVNRPKQLPNSRQRSLPGNAVNVHQPGSNSSGGAARSRFGAANNALIVRTPNVVRPIAPSFNNLRHRSPNPAVLGGAPNSHSTNTGTTDGTRMNHKP